MIWKIVLAIVVGVLASGAIRGHYGWPTFPHGLLTTVGITMALFIILESKLMKELLGKKPEPEKEGGYDREERAAWLYSEASRLEDKGQVKEALAAYDEIISMLGNTEVTNDAKISADELRKRIK